MKRFFIIELLIVSFLVSYSQDEAVNWIFFVDGKIPSDCLLRGEVLCELDSARQFVIPMDYTIGSVRFADKDFQFLKDSCNGTLSIEIHYFEFLYHAQNEYVYHIPIYKEYLLEPYVVFNINNTSRKKETYCLEIMENGSITTWIPYHKHFMERVVITGTNNKISQRGRKHNLFIMKR